MGSVVKAIQKYDLMKVSTFITRPANTTAYAAGDAVSDATGNALFTFSRVLKEGTKHGEILRVGIHASKDSIATALEGELYLFHTAIGLTADNAPWVPSEAEMKTRIGVVEFPSADWRLWGTGSICDVYPNMPFVIGTDTLYGQLVAQNAYAPASGEIFTIELVVAQY